MGKIEGRMIVWQGYGFIVVWIWIVTVVVFHFMGFSEALASNSTVVEIFITGLMVALFYCLFRRGRIPEDRLYLVPLKYWPLVCFLIGVLSYIKIHTNL